MENDKPLHLPVTMSMKHYICNLFEIKTFAISLGLLLLSMDLSAAEYRVPMEGIRSYDNSQDWFLTHEDAYPMAGEAVDNLAEFSSSVWFCIEKLPYTRINIRPTFRG